MIRDKGLVIFKKVEDAIAAEEILKRANYAVRLVAPPATFRMGCDLAVEINLVEELSVERLFSEKGVNYLKVTPLQGGGELLDVVKVTSFEGATMVKAANMKLTFDDRTGVILNISGGGCPDIPYLSVSLIGRKITEALRPRENGFTLCAMMLDRAFVECLQLWKKRAS